MKTEKNKQSKQTNLFCFFDHRSLKWAKTNKIILKWVPLTQIFKIRSCNFVGPKSMLALKNEDVTPSPRCRYYANYLLFALIWWRKVWTMASIPESTSHTNSKGSNTGAGCIAVEVHLSRRWRSVSIPLSSDFVHRITRSSTDNDTDEMIELDYTTSFFNIKINKVQTGATGNNKSPQPMKMS